MTTHTIQTHKLIQQLVKTGLSETQSTAIVEGSLETQQDFATKQDLNVVRSELELVISQTANKIIMAHAVFIGLAIAIIKFVPGVGA